MPSLFDPFSLRGVTLRNRVGVSPMCQYSCEDGFATDWHLVHLGARAVGGAALVIAEASAVEARGRISPQDLGIWKDEHIEPLARAVRFIASQGAAAGIQLAHAGRKASTAQPWKGGKPISIEQGGWQPIGASPLPFDAGYATPQEMTLRDINEVRYAFVEATKRSLQAGFDLVELHFAHGYLIHSFLSPLSNDRSDNYGGSFENRIRFALETTREVRRVWPADKPLAARLSCSDWTPGGWDIEQSVELAKRLKSEGVDLIDCSSGGNVPNARIELKPGYQVPFAEAIHKQAQIRTAAVGLITEPGQANQIIEAGQADMVFLARQVLRDPYWPVHAAGILNQKEKIRVPEQYGRAM